MLSSLPEDSELKTFLLKERGWLLKTLEGYTGLIFNGFLKSNNPEITRSVKRFRILRKSLTRKSGVYFFTEKTTGQQYVGSTIDFLVR